ncbi:MAG: flagellar biosynthesis protein FlhF [Bdellovibrionaceae bacterium]|nr:flagellar biosynthesis protein FlhF [Pseudobdellovibrionaceae bacterium]
MQVKKFEARTMKEALEMVKSQLGPDAIILSARDNQRSFGLVGEGSVEITAAVSEDTLQKKKFAESRLRGQDLERFSASPARVQKNIINQMVTKYVEKTQPRPVTTRRYADIEDESGGAGAGSSENGRQLETLRQMAAQQAREIHNLQQAQQQRPVASTPERGPARKTAAESEEIVALKGEIATLRDVISKFQNIPQSMVGTHPGADYGIPFDLSFLFEKLTSAGISEDIVAEILTLAQESIPALKIKNKNLVEAWVARHILETTKVTDGNIPGKVHLFVGPAGSGKTTAMVKMASHLVMNERKTVALLTADTHRVGSADQMRIYAQILNVPFAMIRSASDWSNLVRYLSSVDVVLVDMPGLSLKNPAEIEAVKALMPPAMLNPRVHFVASATSKDADLTDSGRRYSVIGFDDVIFTSLDESVQHGTIYNFMRRFNVPLHGFGVGPRVPEDFETATRERVLDLIFRITTSRNPSIEAGR